MFELLLLSALSFQPCELSTVGVGLRLKARCTELEVPDLVDLEAGKWQGPFLSGYGLHLVFIEEVLPGRPLTLEEAERDVRRDWDNEQRVKAIDTLYEKLSEDYTITIESPADGEAAS